MTSAKLPPGDEPDDGSADPPNARSESGRRKDGKPYKEGNTREDGSYEVGKNRPDKKYQFRQNDGRKRGKREKGSKNVATVWRKQLHRKITHEGKTQTALEWLIEGTIRRGITKSDRASETAIERAERLEANSDNRLGLTEQEIVDAWLADRLTGMMRDVTDDNDTDEGDGLPSDEGGDDNEDQ